MEQRKIYAKPVGNCRRSILSVNTLRNHVTPLTILPLRAARIR
jgi:hypothetical protein